MHYSHKRDYKIHRVLSVTFARYQWCVYAKLLSGQKGPRMLFRVNDQCSMITLVIKRQFGVRRVNQSYTLMYRSCFKNFACVSLVIKRQFGVRRVNQSYTLMYRSCFKNVASIIQSYIIFSLEVFNDQCSVITLVIKRQFGVRRVNQSHTLMYRSCFKNVASIIQSLIIFSLHMFNDQCPRLHLLSNASLMFDFFMSVFRFIAKLVCKDYGHWVLFCRWCIEFMHALFYP